MSLRHHPLCDPYRWCKQSSAHLSLFAYFLLQPQLSFSKQKTFHLPKSSLPPQLITRLSPLNLPLEPPQRPFLCTNPDTEHILPKVLDLESWRTTWRCLVAGDLIDLTWQVLVSRVAPCVISVTGSSSVSQDRWIMVFASPHRQVTSSNLC